MTLAALLLENFNMEMAMTRPTLGRIPADKPDYKPHEKSMALGRLAMHVATLPRFASMILGTPSYDLAKPTIPWPDLTFHSTDALLATFDGNVEEGSAALATASDEDLAAMWKFSFGERVLSNNPRALTISHMCVSHLIHHRAQLGVYLRLLNLPVPAVYGPSADEQFTH